MKKIENFDEIKSQLEEYSNRLFEHSESIIFRSTDKLMDWTFETDNTSYEILFYDDKIRVKEHNQVIGDFSINQIDEFKNLINSIEVDEFKFNNYNAVKNLTVGASEYDLHVVDNEAQISVYFPNGLSVDAFVNDNGDSGHRFSFDNGQGFIPLKHENGLLNIDKNFDFISSPLDEMKDVVKNVNELNNEFISNELRIQREDIIDDIKSRLEDVAAPLIDKAEFISYYVDRDNGDIRLFVDTENGKDIFTVIGDKVSIQHNKENIGTFSIDDTSALKQAVESFADNHSNNFVNPIPDEATNRSYIYEVVISDSGEKTLYTAFNNDLELNATFTPDGRVDYQFAIDKGGETTPVIISDGKIILAVNESDAFIHGADANSFKETAAVASDFTKADVSLAETASLNSDLDLKEIQKEENLKNLLEKEDNERYFDTVKNEVGVGLEM